MSKTLVRTDKWRLKPTNGQRQLLEQTVSEYRRLVKVLIGVVYTHWSVIGASKTPQQEVEKLIHQTGSNPNPKYKYFGRAFHKFPSYYRRAAINNAIGQVSSFVTRYYDWQSGIRKQRDAKPPKLTSDTNVYPQLYQGQCVRFYENHVEIKVFTGTDWLWIKISIQVRGNRHLVTTNERLSPALIVNKKNTHLSVPFKCQPEELPATDKVVSVDLGINSTATVSVVTSTGTVIHREFIYPGRNIDRRDQRLKLISRKARQTCRKKSKLPFGFCRVLYRKATNINREISQRVSKKIVKIAQEFSVKTVVFERLKGWKPRGGKKRSTLRQKFHGWCHRRITELTQMKWKELGGEVVYVLPKYTSAYAYDGSGKLKRNEKNQSLAVFQTGKQYNCDLSASYNIAARYWHKRLKLSSRNGSEVWTSKSSSHTPRTPVTLSSLWSTQSQSSRVETPLTARSV